MNEVSPETILDYAATLLARGDALEALDAALTLAGQPLPSSVRGRCLATQVVALEQLEREDEAQTLIENAMEDEAEDFGFILSAGMTFSDLDAPGYAETFLENLCELDPNNPAPWHNYAIVLGRMERYEEALKAYRHALERDASFAPAIAQMAFCYHVLGDDASAMAAYDDYLALEPEDAEAWTSLAMLRSANGETGAAYEAYRRALDAGGDAENIYFNWGLTAAQEQNATALDEALAELETIAPGGWRTWLLRGELRESRGEIETATGAYDAAVSIAATEADPETSAFAVAAALRFAVRRDAFEFAEALEERVFDNRWFTEETLELIRLRRGHDAVAASYQVVFAETAEAGWVYGVYAESADDAEHYARTFHRQARLPELPTFSVQQISEPSDVVVGVYWRSAGAIPLGT